MQPHQRIVFPLDVPHESAAWKWAFRLQDNVGVLKVGLELFTRLGPKAVTIAKTSGFECFLDLKLHDIPNTVGQAAIAAVATGADFLSVHASGGYAMMKAAVDAVKNNGNLTKILAITALTSLDEKDLQGIYGMSDAGDVALKLATIAYEAGARGFVCSPHEVAKLKARFPDATFVVPGVRPAGADVNDQKRVATPQQAIENGADFLVIGRPIRNAEDPNTACAAIADEIRQGLKAR